MEKQILFIDEVHSSLEKRLTESGFSCQKALIESHREIISKNYLAEGIVVRSRVPMDAALISSFKNLRFIARFGAGMENIDLDYCEKHDITCFKAPEGNMTAVAEHAMAMILSLLNHIPRAQAEVQNGIWLRAENRGRELENLKIAIIGYGFMGKALTKRLKAFGCIVLVHDKYKKIEVDGVREVSLETVYKEADIVSLHLPQSEETMGYVNKDFINKMDKPFFLINTARGKHVVSEDLLDGLNSGKVLGAGLDVLDREKASFEGIQRDLVLSKMLKMSNVIITPHIAGWTHESNQKMADVLFEKITSLYK